MPTQIIPSAPSRWRYDVTVELDGAEYILTWRYRQAVYGGGWYIDLATASGVAVVQGRRVSPGADPLQGLVGDDVPPGRFIVQGQDPYRRYDLGGDLLLTYVPVAEVPADVGPPTVTVGPAVVS